MSRALGVCAAAALAVALMTATSARAQSCTTDEDCLQTACSVSQCVGGFCDLFFIGDFFCRDDNPCTQDRCNESFQCPGGVYPCIELACERTPTASGTSCADGDVCDGSETCDGAGTCQPGTAAAAGTSCADGDVCDGSEACDGQGTCQQGASAPAGTSCADNDKCNGDETCNGLGICAGGMALVCDDDNPCTTDGCAAASGCTAATVPAGTSCTDGDVCNGDEACDAGGTCAGGTPLVCDDGNPCTTDACAAASGCTTASAPVGTSCADADLCNGDETCDATGTCAAGTPPACDDGDLCTRDACEPETGCVADGAPASSCLPASTGSLLVDEQRPGYERLVARLAQTDEEVAEVEFGNPLAPDAVDYALCLYDGADAYVGGLALAGGERLCGGKPCWRSVVGSPPGGRRFFYRDPARSEDGIAQLLLRSARARGHDTNVKLSAENHAKRGFTAMPSGLAAALGGSATATMQLVGSDGTCVAGAVQASPKSSATVFRGAVR